MFVAANICRDKGYVATNRKNLRQNFRHDKHTFVHKTFVATKMILVAVPANDTSLRMHTRQGQKSLVWDCQTMPTLCDVLKAEAFACKIEATACRFCQRSKALVLFLSFRITVHCITCTINECFFVLTVLIKLTSNYAIFYILN